jgi:membrane-associated protein
LFSIIFFETGLVLTPFLPGDSLIFITGTIAAQGLLNLFLLFFLLCAAAILGDSLNYSIGKYFGEKIEANRFFKKKYLEMTQKFYEEHGGKTIILARFIPIIRTFAPFVAGISKMEYTRFLSFNVVGGIVWVALFLFSGYYFGLIPFVQNNLTLIVIGVIILSFLPPVFEYLRSRKKRK